MGHQRDGIRASQGALKEGRGKEVEGGRKGRDGVIKGARMNEGSGQTHISPSLHFPSLPPRPSPSFPSRRPPYLSVYFLDAQLQMGRRKFA